METLNFNFIHSLPTRIVTILLFEALTFIIALGHSVK